MSIRIMRFIYLFLMKLSCKINRIEHQHCNIKIIQLNQPSIFIQINHYSIFSYHLHRMLQTYQLSTAIIPHYQYHLSDQIRRTTILLLSQSLHLKIFFCKRPNLQKLIHLLLTIVYSLMGKLKLWASQEDLLLIRASSTNRSKKWKKASQQLKKHGYERTDVECRQRYINHLDPTVNKRLWTQQELQTLYSKYREYGNKWFLIQKHLPGRTQTKIKNYFYGNIRYLLKIIIKMFFRASAGFINDIKTETLLNIYESQEEYEGYNIVSKTIRRLRFKVQKQVCDGIITENRQQFYQFIQFFLQNSKLKSSIYLEPQSPQVVQSSDGESVVEVPCLPAPPIQMKAFGDGQKMGMEELKSLAEHHLKWYQWYQNAYLKLTKETS